MEKKVIKTESDYKAALAAIERLMDLDPDPGTTEAEELELLTLLVQDYEAKRFPVSLPDPVGAIYFRMEQQGLSQRDLIPFLGSRSKVSEVLSGKRSLTLSMIRALHSGLGIPAGVLVKEQGAALPKENDIEWERFPLREMVVRGWIDAKLNEVRDNAEELMRKFLAPLGTPNVVVAVCLKMDHIRSARTMDKYALAAWSLRVLNCAKENQTATEYKPGIVNLEFMSEVARLSWSDQGPLLAQEFLGKHGIQLVIEPHLSRTYLDGAAMMTEDGTPVIGLTIRHDRIDNFWFSLLHELAHVAKHLAKASEAFFDDLDASSGADRREEEADKLAGEALIPQRAWNTSPAKNLRSPESAKHLANKLRIHPAIVAGRMRHEAKNFRILNQTIGLGEVRRHFPNVQWNGGGEKDV